MGFNSQHINNIPECLKFRKGHKHSSETKKLMSEKRKAFYTKGGKHPLKGKTFSTESRLRMSLSHKGQKLSKATRVKLSNARKGERHWNYKTDRSLLSKKTT